jgi:hypothetical protein
MPAECQFVTQGKAQKRKNCTAAADVADPGVDDTVTGPLYARRWATRASGSSSGRWACGRRIPKRKVVGRCCAGVIDERPLRRDRGFPISENLSLNLYYYIDSPLGPI